MNKKNKVFQHSVGSVINPDCLPGDVRPKKSYKFVYSVILNILLLLVLCLMLSKKTVIFSLFQGKEATRLFDSYLLVQNEADKAAKEAKEEVLNDWINSIK